MVSTTHPRLYIFFRGAIYDWNRYVSGVSSSPSRAQLVNGFYAEERIPGYHGARTFRKPGTDLVVYVRSASA
jgi:hypothetical protein